MGARIRWSRPSASAQPSLLCLPYAGGDGAAFRPWLARLGARARVGWAELPGRGDFFGEPPLRRIAEQVEWLLPSAREIAPPLAIFGYSMGALIGFELAHALRELGAPAPALLMVAAHNPPGRPSRREALHALPEDEFLRRVAAFEGTPAEVLGHAELLALLTPRLRADFEACETYQLAARAPLEIPLVVYGGMDDPEVPPAGLLHWAVLTRAQFECVLLPGHHFFLYSAGESLMRDVNKRLDTIAAALS
jgi:surfactin synthase thioesterase subunit